MTRKDARFAPAIAFGAGALLAAGGAGAQELPGVQTSGGTTTRAAAPMITPPAEDQPSDHDKVVGRFAIGFMGVSQLPLATSRPELSAPVIGARYWITRLIGIDAGVGLMVTGGSEQVNGASTDKASRFGMIFHAGVPLALASSRHFTFEVIPELNAGFANSTLRAPNVPDRAQSGSRFDIGARAGAEIHFGFIGIPQLALQGTLGLYFSRLEGGTTVNNVKTGDSTNVFSTSVQSTPWAIFVNNIAALYYF